MGQKSSKQKRDSEATLTPLNTQYPLAAVTSTAPAVNSTVGIQHPLAPDSAHPRTNRSIQRMSQIIDPLELLAEDEGNFPTSRPPFYGADRRQILVQSPSGELLHPHEYLDHPERPLAIHERVGMIRAMMEGIDSTNMPAVVEQSGRERGEGRAKGRRKCYGCGCFGKTK